MPDCQCRIPKTMSWAGPTALLCHHSTADQARELQQRLMDLLEDLPNAIPAEELAQKNVKELAEDYKKAIVGDDYNLMTQEEHDILMIAFLRHLGIAIHALMATIIITKGQQEQTPEPAETA